MASIADKVNYASAVAKWKADQQVRIFRSQNTIREMENQVRVQKASLAEATLAQYANHALTEEGLVNLCEQIYQILGQIQYTNQAIEAIKQEQPPADPALYSSAYPSPMNQPFEQAVNTSDLPLSGLVCPDCGMALVGRFCQVHGKEGVLPNS